MLKSSLALAAAALTAIAPVAALAQDAEAEAKPASTFKYEPINYNLNEDRENVLFLDLSNGERVGIRLMPAWAPSRSAP